MKGHVSVQLSHSLLNGNWGAKTGACNTHHRRKENGRDGVVANAAHDSESFPSPLRSTTLLTRCSRVALQGLHTGGQLSILAPTTPNYFSFAVAVAVTTSQRQSASASMLSQRMCHLLPAALVTSIDGCSELRQSYV